jgi:hypothetical protein
MSARCWTLASAGMVDTSLIMLASSSSVIKAVSSLKDKVHVVSYADDFIITAASKVVLEKNDPITSIFLENFRLLN